MRVVASLLLLIAACTGPRVRVVSAEVSRSPLPGHVRVHARLANAAGRGDVKVKALLRERTTGATVIASASLDLESDAEVDWFLDVAAPEGDYMPSVTASYPPD